MIRVFESCGFEYMVLRPIKYGRDGAPVLLAARKEYLGAATTTAGTQVETTLIRAARKLDEHVAYSVTESGILPAPVDQPWSAP